MIVEVETAINGSPAAVWAVITDIEGAPRIISGIQDIKILERPANGLVGLRWLETRILFGEPATVEKRITEAVENDFYRTQAESSGFVFVTTLRIVKRGNDLALVSSHESRPQTLVAKLQTIPMRLLFKGVMRKAILHDLEDIKAAIEGHPSPAGISEESVV